MFDEDVGKDTRLGANLLSITECIVGGSFYQALIGEHCAGVDVDANERSITSGTKCKRSAGVIAEDVEADRKFDCSADGAAGGSHGRDSFGSDV